ncbi:MAG TPA: hypothetical protein VGL91_02135 [Acidobacteriota bacterium]
MRTFHSVVEFKQQTREKVSLKRQAQSALSNGNSLLGSTRGLVLRKIDGNLESFPSDRLLPWNEITVTAEEAPEVLWIGTTRGAIRYNYGITPAALEYFAGKRWLPDDRVIGIGFQEVAPPRKIIWIETPAGFSRIEYKPMVLAEKASQFEERVRARHVRHGLTASSHLRTAGDLSTNQTVSSDNDGLWTAIYVAAECFRYRVTGETAARDFARQGIRALMRLESITGISGFPARSFIQVGAEERPRDGEWHRTPDGQWEWKGDTSSDEIVGHYFAYSIYYDLVAGETEKKEIRAVVERITSHIIDHGYHLVDVDGKPTRWGWWAPVEIWADASETGLRALHLLSHLRTAYHITGNPKYKAAYDGLVNDHRYALLTRNQKINIPGHVNHSDDELAFLSYYPLLLYEENPKLRGIYSESLERSWLVERAERNPLWNFIYAIGMTNVEGRKSKAESHNSGVAGRRSKVESHNSGVAGRRSNVAGQKSGVSAEISDLRPATFDLRPEAFDLRLMISEAIQTLQQIPMDLITWDVTNSHRLDIVLDPNLDRFHRQQSLLVLSPDERPLMKWNGNPYALDGGNGGRSEDDGGFFLLPYWMGRYHGFTP